MVVITASVTAAIGLTPLVAEIINERHDRARLKAKRSLYAFHCLMDSVPDNRNMYRCWLLCYTVDGKNNRGLEQKAFAMSIGLCYKFLERSVVTYYYRDREIVRNSVDPNAYSLFLGRGTMTLSEIKNLGGNILLKDQMTPQDWHSKLVKAINQKILQTDGRLLKDYDLSIVREELQLRTDCELPRAVLIEADMEFDMHFYHCVSTVQSIQHLVPGGRLPNIFYKNEGTNDLDHWSLQAIVNIENRGRTNQCTKNIHFTLLVELEVKKYGAIRMKKIGPNRLPQFPAAYYCSDNYLGMCRMSPQVLWRICEENRLNKSEYQLGTNNCQDWFKETVQSINKHMAEDKLSTPNGLMPVSNIIPKACSTLDGVSTFFNRFHTD